MVRHLAEEDGMSSDERDGEDDHCFYSSRPHWRSEHVTRWLHDLDYIHSQAYRGDFQRTSYRRPSAKVNMGGKAVKGLPFNFYDWEYLESLDRSQYEDLDVQPSTSLEFRPSVQRFVTCFILFATGTDDLQDVAERGRLGPGWCEKNIFVL